MLHVGINTLGQRSEVAGAHVFIGVNYYFVLCVDVLFGTFCGTTLTAISFSGRSFVRWSRRDISLRQLPFYNTVLTRGPVY